MSYSCIQGSYLLFASITLYNNHTSTVLHYDVYGNRATKAFDDIPLVGVSGTSAKADMINWVKSMVCLSTNHTNFIQFTLYLRIE